MGANRYRHLDGAKISATATRLRDRILDRFPGSGLGEVAGELVEITERATARTRSLRKPYWAVRLAIGVVLLGMIAALCYLVPQLRYDVEDEIARATSFVQVLEATCGSVFFLGALTLFLWTLEGRLKRSRALRAIHELRSLAHIVDMHQLTKEPERLQTRIWSTPSSPRRELTEFQLSRYFDYCSELLSITGKVAALYVENLSDPVVLAAVDQVEALTTGLSRKIWQKIMLLDPARMAAEGQTVPGVIGVVD